MNTTLYILVDEFSGKDKEAFFEKELPYHCAHFKKVYVVSLYPDENPVLNFNSANLEVLRFNYFSASNRIRVAAKYWLTILRVYLYEFFKTHNKLFYIKHFPKLLNQLILTISAAEKLEKFIEKDINSTTLFYTYWFKQWTAALSIIKIRQSKLKFISRVHGADYDEEQVKSVLPFRHFQLSQVNKIYPVSVFAKKYLQSRFKVSADKIEVSRLGIQVEKQLSPIDESELHIVSCSSIIPLKRVDLIVEILKHIKIPVKWTHFGDGPLAKAVKQKAAQLESYIEVNFLGHVSNDAFLNYLKNNAVGLFINVSDSEGLPVSMMEAIAHGIPLIGTDICGVPEIVVPETGFLFPVNFDPAKVADTIVDEHKKGEIYKPIFRNNIYEFYLKNFKGSVNHEKFSSKILSLCAE